MDERYSIEVWSLDQIKTFVSAPPVILVCAEIKTDATPTNWRKSTHVLVVPTAVDVLAVVGVCSTMVLTGPKRSVAEFCATA